LEQENSEIGGSAFTFCRWSWSCSCSPAGTQTGSMCISPPGNPRGISAHNKKKQFKVPYLSAPKSEWRRDMLSVHLENNLHNINEMWIGKQSQKDKS
jgi:hypothetical protein